MSCFSVFFREYARIGDYENATCFLNNREVEADSAKAGSNETRLVVPLSE